MVTLSDREPIAATIQTQGTFSFEPICGPWYKSELYSEAYGLELMSGLTLQGRAAAQSLLVHHGLCAAANPQSRLALETGAA
jgi:hypothetical protein